MPSRCSVPKCTGNYTKDITENGSVSTFSFPKDPAMLMLWKASIPNLTDKINTTRGRVCSRHFHAYQVIWHDIVEGVSYKRDRPRLADDAVPTIFPTPPPRPVKPPVPHKRSQDSVAKKEKEKSEKEKPQRR